MKSLYGWYGHGRSTVRIRYELISMSTYRNELVIECPTASGKTFYQCYMYRTVCSTSGILLATCRVTVLVCGEGIPVIIINTLLCRAQRRARSPFDGVVHSLKWTTALHLSFIMMELQGGQKRKRDEGRGSFLQLRSGPGQPDAF